jgi:hypothetical protein
MATFLAWMSARSASLSYNNSVMMCFLLRVGS